MSVRSTNKFKRHSGGTLSRIQIAARSTKTTSASKRGDHQMTAIITTIKGISTLEVAAMNHFIDILNNGITNCNTGISKFVKVI